MTHLAGRLFLLALTVLLGTSGSVLAQSTEAIPPGEPAVDAGNLRAFIELTRSDIRTRKTLIIAQNIQFTDDEAVEFWPLHSEYSLALDKLLDERLRILREYLAGSARFTDREATRLAGKVFDLEDQRTRLKRVWFRKFSKVVPAKKAAQFFQIENQLNAVLDLRLAAALPLIR